MQSAKRPILLLFFLVMVHMLHLDAQGRYVILRKASGDLENCYQFYLADASIRGSKQMAGVDPVAEVPFVTEMAQRQGWEVDPMAHPPGASWPYMAYETASAIMNTLSPFGKDAYGCLGAPQGSVPVRQGVSPTPLAGSGVPAPGWVLLRKPDRYQPSPGPPVCFQFTVVDLRNTARPMAAWSPTGGVSPTEYAVRQGWSLEPSAFNPYPTLGLAEAYMNQLSRFGGDLYQCLRACPANSHWNLDAWGNRDCFCNDGYSWNFDRTQCVRIAQSGGEPDPGGGGVPGGTEGGFPPTAAERAGVLQAIEDAHQRWFDKWCASMWSGCAIEPGNARNWLKHRAETAPTTDALGRVMAQLRCHDPVFMADLEEAEFHRRTAQCREQDDLAW